MLFGTSITVTTSQRDRRMWIGIIHAICLTHKFLYGTPAALVMPHFAEWERTGITELIHIIVIGLEQVCDLPHIKNFGNSGAIITEFRTDKDLQELMPKGRQNPFAHMEGAVLAPGQCYRTAVSMPNAKTRLDKVTFHIKYKSSTHEYVEEVPLKIEASNDQLYVRASTEGQELKIISYALQDLAEKHM